jgi:hypothetical protein
MLAGLHGQFLRQQLAPQLHLDFLRSWLADLSRELAVCYGQFDPCNTKSLDPQALQQRLHMTCS